MAGFSAAKCADVTTVSKLVRDGMIYVTKNDDAKRTAPFGAAWSPTRRGIGDMASKKRGGDG
jgi:hypothetical protein